MERCPIKSDEGHSLGQRDAAATVSFLEKHFELIPVILLCLIYASMSLDPHTQLSWYLSVLIGQAFFADCFLLSKIACSYFCGGVTVAKSSPLNVAVECRRSRMFMIMTNSL